MADPRLRLLIVDDESPARDLLRVICAEQAVAVVGEAGMGEAAIELTEQLRPDLVLLDIAMPGMGGMAAARRMVELPYSPAIVFTTAFEGYALTAFDVGAVDYLLKPIVDQRFAVMLDRVRAVRQTAGQAPAEEYIWVPMRSQLKRVLLAAIECVTAERDYVNIEVDGRSYLLRATMDVMAGRLDPLNFVRIHRSAIVRKDLITGLHHDGGGVWSAMLSQGERMRIGRSYLDAVRSLLAGAC
ncbi:LytR/AlgR family response regulator transcription factor [Rhodanobacter sp. BL-MT-08]